MPKITIDETEYEVKEDDQEKMQLLNMLSLGSNALNLLNHIAQCVNAVQQGKTQELKTSLGVKDEEKKSKK